MVADQQLSIESIILLLYLLGFNAVVLLIFVNALDDLFVDCVYVFQRLYRAVVIKPKYKQASAQSMRALRAPQQAFAICVPAWDEQAVIAQMLERAVRSIRYDNYRIFVGVYANDPATRSAIEALCARNGDCAHRIRIVTHDVPGPTSKADCLNSLYHTITQDDAWAAQEHVQGFILHDAEDIIHPSELVVFNHLIAKADIIQLPVTPLARPLTDLVGGHYLDEFAESHTKDLVVREALGAPLPCAGVGCAFSARALKALAKRRGGAPFNAESVTEDYDIALDLADMGFRAIFVRLPSQKGVASYVATQEYFPNTVRTAIRQKGRWLLGIALENWTVRGWRGNWAARYMLWRDRKALLTAFSAVAAYVLLACFFVIVWAFEFTPEALFDYIVPPGGIVSGLLVANLVFLINRLLQRFTFVYRSYGLWQALISPVRIVVGNWINFFAALRAARLFRTSRKTRGQKVWFKTHHQIPTASVPVKLPGSR
ncbi:MAG: glycosyl transferase family protein [Pseudomonadota bacterium]